MSLSLRKKSKSIVREVPDVIGAPVRVASLAMTSVAVIFSGMILFNAFLGQHLESSVLPLQGTNGSSIPAEKSSRMVTLIYSEMIEDVQRELLATGQFQGLVDGVDGPKTRIAIEQYQKQFSLDVTGEATKKLLEHIRFTKKVAQASEFTGSVATVEPDAAPEAEDIEISLPVIKPKKLLVVDDVPPAPPVAIPVRKTEPKVAAKSAESKATPILQLQKRLAKLGFDPGVRSGEVDEATRSAILSFELANGLSMEGKVTKTLLNALQQVEQQAAQ